MVPPARGEGFRQRGVEGNAMRRGGSLSHPEWCDMGLKGYHEGVRYMEGGSRANVAQLGFTQVAQPVAVNPRSEKEVGHPKSVQSAIERGTPRKGLSLSSLHRSYSRVTPIQLDPSAP
jgi:hypothetical protein